MAWMRVYLAAFVLGTVACVGTVPYGEDAPAGQKKQATTTSTAAPQPERPRADSTTSAALDAGPAGCDPQAVTWTASEVACTAQLEASIESGTSQTLTDTSGDATGKVTVTCDNGRLTQSGMTCELPKKFDVGSGSGCINGYCSAATGGQCGVPDKAKATAFCVYKGYTKYVDFTTMPGPNNQRQCHPDGTGCFVNANPSCNIVFSSVTCAR